MTDAIKNFHIEENLQKHLVVQSGRICAVSEARSAVRTPARGGREPTPCLGGDGSEPTPCPGGTRGRGASPVRGKPQGPPQAGLLTADLGELNGADFHTVSIVA